MSFAAASLQIPRGTRLLTDRRERQNATATAGTEAEEMPVVECPTCEGNLKTVYLRGGVRIRGILYCVGCEIVERVVLLPGPRQRAPRTSRPEDPDPS